MPENEKKHVKKISDTSSHKYAWLLVIDSLPYQSVSVLLGTSMEIGHVHIVASTRVSALQLGQDAAFWNCQPRSVDPVQPTPVISSTRSIWPIPYQSKSQKNPKDIQFECSSKKYLIIYLINVARYGNISTLLSSSDGIWSHKLSRVHDSSMPEHRTATKEAADLPVFLGDLRWIVSSQLPPSS